MPGSRVSEDEMDRAISDLLDRLSRLDDPALCEAETDELYDEIAAIGRRVRRLRADLGATSSNQRFR